MQIHDGRNIFQAWEVYTLSNMHQKKLFTWKNMKVYQRREYESIKSKDGREQKKKS